MKVVQGKKEDLVKALRLLDSQSKSSQKLALVPTMGYLHQGHKKLMEEAKALGLSAVSIFVNPLQFNDPEDYKNYPRNIEHDLEVCRESEVDLVFQPSPQEIYNNGTPALELSIPQLAQGLCGKSRPGHFEGVLFIVLKLLLLFQPKWALFGKKDYQQYLIIKRMVQDLDLPVEILGIETLRQDDSLAFSSRNAQLSPEGKQNATLIYRALKIGYKAYLEGQNSTQELKEIIKDVILSGTQNRIDYIEIVETESLRPLGDLDKRKAPFLIAVAVFCEKVRLIDNLECRERS